MTSQPPSYRASHSTTRPKPGSADPLLQSSLISGSALVASSLSSASLLRSTPGIAHANDVPSQADALLQASLARRSGSVASSPSSASILRPSTSQADALLNASLTGSNLSASSATTAAPPSYRRSPGSVTRTVTGASSSSPLSHNLCTRTRLQSTADKDAKTLSQLNEAADKAARDRLLSQSATYTNLPGMYPIGRDEKHTSGEYLDNKIDGNADPSSPPRLTAAQSKEYLCQMQAQVNQVNARRPPRATAGVFRKACSTDVLFLLDTTNSMRPYIDAARDQVKSIVRDIKATFLDETEVRIAIPHGLTYEPLLQKMVQLRLNYAFLRIHHWTDRMVLKFSEIYAAAGADGTAGSRLWSGPSGKATAEIQFEEMLLGTSFSMLKHLVVRTVTRSASLSATRVISEASQHSETQTQTSFGFGKLMAWTKQLTMIRETEDNPEPATTSVPSNIELEDVLPQWTTPSWFKDSLTLEGFCPDTGVHDASTLNEMMAADENVKLCVTQLTVRKRPRPFAQGAMRLAYYALTANSTNKFVVKTFKKDEEDAMAQMIEDMRAQALCKAFALEFNSLLKEAYAIDFIVTTGWQVKSRKSAPNSCLSLEPFIDGEYVKYNNNAGHVKEQDTSDPFNDAAQAFSHFTYERSFGTFMVTDLQGCGHILTDPAIHTKDPNRFKLSPTNQGIDGFKFFFATHICNTVCTKLGLQSKKEMFIDDKWEFREIWLTVDNTVFCSNKLCRKIIRVTSAQTSANYPGCHWCQTCWLQLQPTTVQWHCEEPGPDHLFDVSLFYHESQGQAAPNKCPAHLEKDTTGFTAAAAGSMLLSRINLANKRSSTSGRAW